MKRLILVICLSLLAVGQAHARDRAPRRGAQRALKVACVGDSLTYGFGLRPRAQQAYPAALGRVLGSGHAVKNFGANGCTVLRSGAKPYWDKRALSRATAENPDRVVVMFGSNDSKQACWSPAAFKRDLTALVERFQALPSRPQVLLCTPTPVFRDRWGVRGQVVADEVIPQIRAVAADKRLQVVDLHGLLRGAPQRFPDGIHPDAEAARRMAAEVGRVLQAGRR